MTNKSTDIYPVVLLSLLVLIPWGQCIPKRWDLVLVAPKAKYEQMLSATKMSKKYSLFVLVSGRSPVFLGLRRVNHDGLSSDLLVTHRESHKDRFGSVKFDVCDSNRT